MFINVIRGFYHLLDGGKEPLKKVKEEFGQKFLKYFCGGGFAAILIPLKAG